MYSALTIRIVWTIVSDVPLTGTRGIDAKTIPLKNLHRWAKKRKKAFKKDVRKGWEDASQQDVDAGEEAWGAMPQDLADNRRMKVSWTIQNLPAGYTGTATLEGALLNIDYLDQWGAAHPASG